MNKRLCGVMGIGLSFALLTGCYSFPTAKLAGAPAASQTTGSSQKESEPNSTTTNKVGAAVPIPAQKEAQPSADTDVSSTKAAIPQQPSEAVPVEPRQPSDPAPSEPQKPSAETAAIQVSQKQEDNPSNTVAKASSVSVEHVKRSYEAQLMQLKGSYLSQIQKLYNDALAAIRGGQTTRSVYDTYSKQALALEEKSQDQVNGLLFQMKNELTTDSLPTDSVNELRAAYYNELDQAQKDYEQKAKTDMGK